MEEPDPREVEKQDGEPDVVSFSETASASSNEPNEPSDDSELKCKLCDHVFIGNAKKNNYRKHTDDPPGYCLVAQARSARNPKQSANPGVNAATDSTLLHQHISQLRSTTKILRRVPKAARYQAGLLLKEVVRSCIEKGTADDWKKLFTFSYAAFYLAPTKKSCSQATIVKRNLTSIENGTFCTQSADTTKKRNGKGGSNRGKLVSAKFQDGDVRGAVRMLASDEKVAPDCDRTVKILREKHPQKSSQPFPEMPANVEPVYDVTTEEILMAVKSFPNGSSGGIDGLKPQHLKDLLAKANGEAATQLCETLKELANNIIKNQVPKEHARYLFGATLTPLLKPDGGIRPIAVGNTLRRMTSKVVSTRLQNQAGEHLRPTQLGCGTRAGAEIVVHAVRNSVSAVPAAVSMLVKLDFKNAFNSVHRQKMLQVCGQFAPSYAPFFWQCYREDTVLLYRSHVIESQRGVQQGDPMGPLMFSIGIHPLVSSLSSELNIWYLDDGTVGGHPDDVIADLRKILEAQEECGLELNLQKCETLIFGGTEEDRKRTWNQLYSVAPGIRRVAKSELTLLGAPLSEESSLSVWEAKCQEVKRLVDSLDEIKPHQALFLLKNCLLLPKVQYFLRTSPLWKLQSELKKFDEFMRSSVTRIFNVPVEESEWLQASLPVKMGGLGIRRAEGVALSAYLASAHFVSVAVTNICSDSWEERKEEAQNQWSAEAGRPAPEVISRKSQKSWEKSLLDNQLTELKGTLTDIESKARLLAVSQPEASDWLETVPTGPNGTLMDANSVRIAIAHRLGTKVCVSHACRCGAEVDERGLHGLSCKFSAGRISRHTEINKIIQRALITAGFPTIREPPGLSRTNGKRPDGQTPLPFKEGRTAVWDFTTADTMALSYIARTNATPGKAAEEAERRKRGKYAFLGSDYYFAPVAFETFGTWGPSAKDFLGKIGQLLNDVSGDHRSQLYFRQRLSVALQRGNACCVLGTAKESVGLDEIYYVLDAD